jgi:hypothetical protein
VVADLQALGQDSDRCPESRWPAFDCQKRLVLLWLDGSGARSDCTEVQEPAYLVP